jgi:hypothetical protein
MPNHGPGEETYWEMVLEREMELAQASLARAGLARIKLKAIRAKKRFLAFVRLQRFRGRQKRLGLVLIKGGNELE